VSAGFDVAAVRERFLGAVFDEQTIELSAAQIAAYARACGERASAALRRRVEDVILLAQHFIRHAARRHGQPVPRITPAARAALETHDWPGNVRELEYVVERAVVLSAGGATLGAEAFFDHADSAVVEADAAAMPFRVAKSRVVDQFEKQYIERQLAAHGGNISRAARASAKDRRAFWELIRKHGIDAERYRVGV